MVLDHRLMYPSGSVDEAEIFLALGHTYNQKLYFKLQILCCPLNISIAERVR